MKTPTNQRRNNMRTFLILMVPWILLNYLPWVVWLENLPWLRLGIACIIFITPGLSISLFLMGKKLTLLSHFTSGVTLSVFIVSFLGVIGKIVHLPFEFIKTTFFIIGLASLLTLNIHMYSMKKLFRSERFSFVSALLLLLMITLGVIVSLTSRFQYDDFTHLAYLTTWQHSPRLNFGEVIFGVGNLEPTRFWFAMLPMSHALLAEISNLHGLILLGYYLSPFFVAISLLSIYSFYKKLLHSNLQATIALLVQFTFFFTLLVNRQPGNMFFLRITEDKSFAAFALAPTLFLALSCLLESPSFRNGTFLLLSGWGLALVHPVILAYGIFVSGIYAIIVVIPRKNYKTLGIVLAVLIIVILPFTSLRFLSGTAFTLESSLAVAPEGDRISYIEGTPFYGFNLNTIKIRLREQTPSQLNVFLSWTYLWLLGLGFLWSLIKLRSQSLIAPYVAAATALVILCAIPYTGWLVGYFVSPRMLWRSLWFFPAGLVGLKLMLEAISFLYSRVISKLRRNILPRNLTFVSILLTCVVTMIYFSAYRYQNRWQSFDNLREYKTKLEMLSTLGNDLESNISEPSIVISSYGMMNYLPGISSKTKVVFFRGPLFTPYPVDHDKLELISAYNEDISIEQRKEVFHSYNIRYLLIKDSYLKEYYSGHPQFFNLQDFGEYWLFEYRQ